jgi:hypothetical protein
MGETLEGGSPRARLLLVEANYTVSVTKENAHGKIENLKWKEVTTHPHGCMMDDALSSDLYNHCGPQSQ